MDIHKINAKDEKALKLVWDTFIKYEAPDYPANGVETFRKSVIVNDEYLDNLVMYGAYDDEELVGVIATRNDGNHIALFFVDGSHHRQGIGKQLFEEVKKDNISGKITVNSSPYAVDVYHALGFVDLQEEQITDGMRYTPMTYDNMKKFNSTVFEDTMVNCTWKDVDKMAKDKVPVLFPLGVIEEHGPHIPLGADIFWSYSMCRMVKDKLKIYGRESVIAPPYYWGVNHCTGTFPGTFSLKPSTMEMVLMDIFDNLAKDGFKQIYCFNYHADSVHVGTIVEAIKKTNSKNNIKVKLVVDAMDLPINGWIGDEDFLTIVEPMYPLEWFEGDEFSQPELLDIHAGAFETAVLNYMYPGMIDLDMCETLPNYSLDEGMLSNWLKGGENTKKTVPLGYAGNPVGYKSVSKHVGEMLRLQVENIANQI